MEFNLVAAGIELLGTTIKNLTVENSIIDIEKKAKRSFGLNINEPYIEKIENGLYAEAVLDFEIEIEESKEEKFTMKLSLEGAFLSEGEVDEKSFKQLVGVNGAAAIIGIARGRIEAITSNILNNGKVTIPFVNVIDYYKSLEE